MTFDPSTRRLVGLMDELGAGDDGYVEDVLLRTATLGQRPAWTFGPRWVPLTTRRAAALVALTAILTLVVGTAAYVASRPRPTLPTGTVSNGWVAFSTQPGSGRQVGSTDTSTGSELYLAKPGVPPIVVADRLGGVARNVCPTFSPDGRTLAWGTSRSGERSLMTIEVSPDGVIEGTRRAIPLPGVSAYGPCPRWSADGQRLAYLEAGKTIVRGLDGSTVPWTDADPHLGEFTFGSADDPLRSPRGDRVVQTGDQCTVMLSTSGGPFTALPGVVLCGYSIAGWSPDGSQILVMVDVSGRDFTVHAIDVEDPSHQEIVASMIRTNGARSWPGRGDVSWQPVFD